METITATRLLAEAGLTLFKAKRTVERAIETGRVYVRLPHVQKPADLMAKISATGLEARMLIRLQSDQISAQIKKLRAQLDLSQEQFALRYGFDVDALQNWEQGRREPPGSWLFAYLCAIAQDPEGTSRALEHNAPKA